MSNEELPCGGVDVIVALNEGIGGEEIDVTVAAGQRVFDSFFYRREATTISQTRVTANVHHVELEQSVAIDDESNWLSAVLPALRWMCSSDRRRDFSAGSLVGHSTHFTIFGVVTQT